MIIPVTLLPADTFGDYVVQDAGGLFPNVPGTTGFPGQRYLASPAAASVAQMRVDGYQLRHADLLRSPTASLNAISSGRGTQYPGYSGHNYGWSTDIDVEDCLARFSMDKAGLDALMESYGWYCHRMDHANASEWWHYNYFGEDVARYLAACDDTTNPGLQLLLDDHFGAEFTLDATAQQTALAQLKLYHVAIDGIIGPHTQAAIDMFKRAYAVQGEDPAVERVLVLATATFQEVP